MYNCTILFITFHCSLKKFFMKNDLISHFYGVRDFLEEKVLKFNTTLPESLSFLPGSTVQLGHSVLSRMRLRMKNEHCPRCQHATVVRTRNSRKSHPGKIRPPLPGMGPPPSG